MQKVQMVIVLLTILSVGGLSPAALAQNDPNKVDAPVQAFDPQDPQIMALRELDYKNINLDEVDIDTKQIAVIALSEMLGHHGMLARRRLDKLNAFLAMKQMKAAYLKWAAANPLEFKSLTPEDAARLAVAYVRSPVGQGDYAHRLLGVDEEVKQRMFNALKANCLKEFAEVRDNRRTVESMARYLESQNAFEEYLSWAEADVARQKKEHQERMDKLRAQAAQDEMAKRQLILEVQRERNQRQHEMRMARMEHSYKLKEEAIKANAQVRTARYQRGWGGYWGDVYRRGVYRRR